MVKSRALERMSEESQRTLYDRLRMTASDFNKPTPSFAEISLRQPKTSSVLTENSSKRLTAQQRKVLSLKSSVSPRKEKGEVRERQNQILRLLFSLCQKSLESESRQGSSFCQCIFYSKKFLISLALSSETIELIPRQAHLKITISSFVDIQITITPQSRPPPTSATVSSSEVALFIPLFCQTLSSISRERELRSRAAKSLKKKSSRSRKEMRRRETKAFLLKSDKTASNKKSLSKMLVGLFFISRRKTITRDYFSLSLPGRSMNYFSPSHSYSFSCSRASAVASARKRQLKQLPSISQHRYSTNIIRTKAPLARRQVRTWLQSQ